MKKVKRKWDILLKGERQACIEEIITFFRDEHDKELGLITAEEILDFFLQSAGERIYNKGVEDSRQLIKERFYDMEVDLDLL